MQDPSAPTPPNQMPLNQPNTVNPTTSDSNRPVFMTSEEPLNQSTSTPDTASNTPPDVAAFTVAPSGGNISAKKIAAILGIVVVVGATGAGVFLASRQQLMPASAWDCEKYNFAVSRDGAVSVINGSTRNEPIQKATVKVNNSQVASFDVPALSPGQSANLGNVDVPNTGTFSWEVIGTLDCKDGGSYQGQAEVQCSGVKAFDKNWGAISSAQLSSLKTGDVVRFTISSTASSGTLDKARFTINGTQRAEVTGKRPGSEEFFDEYTIPAGVASFTVTAQVHHQQTDSWH